MYSLKAIRCKKSKLITDKLVMVYDDHGIPTSLEIRGADGTPVPELSKTSCGKLILGAELMDRGFSAWVNKKWILDLKTENVQGDWEN